LTVASTGGVGDRSPEVETLRRTISDVVAFSTLSAVWAGAARPKIAESLAEVLREALDSQTVWVGLRATADAAACEGDSVRGADGQLVRDAIRAELAAWLRAPGPGQQVPQLPGRLSGLVVTPIGI